MSLLLYMDHNVHAAITRSLRQRGIDCMTADEDGHATTPDEVLLARATELRRVVFTQDIDFLEIAARWQALRRTFAGVIYARQMAVTIGEAIRDLELMATVLDPAEMIGQVEWIPLR